MHVTKRTFLITAAAAAGSLVVAGPLAAQGAPLTLVATTGMIADTARSIGGSHVDVRALMGPGVDPHGYRQTRSDILAMARADLVLWHGLYLEAQMEAFFEDLSRKKTVVGVAGDLPKGVLLHHDDYADKPDPHVWMDPLLWQQVTDRILETLIAARPEAASEFTANAKVFNAQLQTLGAYSSVALKTVPAEQRVLVTAHDAFNYFGAAHDFEVLGIQGISTDSEAGLSRISNLVDTLVERNIGAVFVESSVSDRNMRALIEGAQARGHDVNIGGQLYSDAMGPDGTYEGTYLGMIDHNVTTIANALGGSAPAQGMAGRLSAGI